MTARPSRSGHCLQDAHERCPHRAGLRPVGPWRRRSPSEWGHVVCECGCHAGCPLTGRRTVAAQAWRHECTCRGAEPVRATEQRREERRRAVAGVYAEARHDGLRDAAHIERRLRAVFQEDGEDPPPGLATAARVAAVTNTRRGTRTARLLWMAARGVAATVHWAWESAGHRDDEDRRQARAMYRVLGALAALATVLTVASARSSGRRRLASGAGAAATWLAAGTGLTLGTAVTQVARSAGDQPTTPTGGPAG